MCWEIPVGKNNIRKFILFFGEILGFSFLGKGGEFLFENS